MALKPSRIFTLIVFCLFSSALWAIYCLKCGGPITGRVNFCPQCGFQQAPESSHGEDFSNWKTLPKPLSQSETPSRQALLQKSPQVSRTAPPGGISNLNFLKLFQTLDRYEQSLKQGFDALPENRPIIQEYLIPEVKRIKGELKAGKIRLTKVQLYLLKTYFDFFKSQLDGSIALGYRKTLAQAMVEQQNALKFFIKNYLETISTEEIEKIMKCFDDELKNLHAQIVELNQQAGFEKTGIAYFIRQEEFAPKNPAIDFVLYFQSNDHRVGQRMKVFITSQKKIGELNYSTMEGGYRKYVGTIPFSAFSQGVSRELQIEYAAKSKFLPKWQMKKVSVFLLPHITPGNIGECSLEATFGPTPGISRVKFLRSQNLQFP